MILKIFLYFIERYFSRLLNKTRFCKTTRLFITTLDSLYAIGFLLKLPSFKCT